MCVCVCPRPRVRVWETMAELQLASSPHRTGSTVAEHHALLRDTPRQTLVDMECFCIMKIKILIQKDGIKENFIKTCL